MAMTNEMRQKLAKEADQAVGILNRLWADVQRQEDPNLLADASRAFNAAVHLRDTLEESAEATP